MNRMMHIIAAGVALSVANFVYATSISDFDAGGDLVISTSGEITVDADATFSSITIEADNVSFVNPDAATTNTLKVAKVYNTSSTIPVFNCRVVFEDEWTASVPIWVSATSQPVDFAGGVVGTYPAPQTAAARTFKGRYVLNGNWTMPSGSLTFTIPSGSTLTGRKVTGAGDVSTYSTLFIAEGAYADIDYIDQGLWTMLVSVNGTLKVNYFNVLRGNVGVNGNTGTLIVDWLAVASPVKTPYDIRIFVPNVVFGGLFDWNVVARLALCAANEVNLQFTENALWGRTANYNANHRTGGDVFFNTQSPDTGVGYVVQLERGFMDNDVNSHGVVGKGHIVKNGMGAMIFGAGILASYNTFSGGTTINQGMVASRNAGQNIGTGTVTVNSGGVLNPAGGGSLGYPIVVNDGGTAIFLANTTASSLTLNSGSTLQVSAACTLTATALTLPESGTVNLLVTGGSTTEGPITLLSFPSGMTSTDDETVNAALLAKFSLVRNNGTLAIDAENNALVMTDYTAPTFSWVGGTDDKFSTPANWSSGYAPAPGDAIEFTASAGGSLTNDIVGLGFNTTVTFAAGAGQYIIAGEPFVSVTCLYNKSSYQQTLNNAVHCKDLINISCSQKLIDFAGGVIGERPNGYEATSRTLVGKWRSTAAWTQSLSTTYTISDGSSLYGRSYAFNGSSNQGSTRPWLVFSSGSYGEFYEMNIGNQRNVLDVAGNLKTRIFKTGYGNAGTYEASGIFDVTESFSFYNTGYNYDCRYHYIRLGGSMVTMADTSHNTVLGNNAANVSSAHGTTIQASADATISSNNGPGYGYKVIKMMEFDTEDKTSGEGHTITMNASILQNSSTFVRKIGKGTVVLNGTANTYANGCYVNGGTLIANHATACGTGATTVADGAVFAVTNGEISVTTLSATLAEGATLAVGVTDRSSAAIANTLAVNGAATLQVMGDVSSLTESTNIPLAGTCTEASLANLTLDSSRLALPDSNWQVRTMLDNRSLALRVVKPGFVILFR